MSIFGRDDESRSKPAPPTTPDKPKPHSPSTAARPGAERSTAGNTVISAGTRIEGEISGATDVVIEGSLEGRVSVESLVSVGKTGQVRGEIRAESISVAGKVFGNIVGGDKVDIHPTGKLEGDVKAPRVSIADGAYFKGRVEMTGQARPEASGKATTSSAPSKIAASPSGSGQSGPSQSGSPRSGSAPGGSSGDQGTRPVDKPPIRPASLDNAKARESSK